MAKALLALALWLCISPSVLADTPSKKTPAWGELNSEQQQILAPLAFVSLFGGRGPILMAYGLFLLPQVLSPRSPTHSGISTACR